ncbi:putative polyprotein [Plasmopara halstedii]|uniref:Putative polyprotein n=1 Tax=Plasmopara halstedii TaxID=4781 RepID=A0A0P1AJM3_PLAHL|nr:putative polyprotein [Plasmopara halstedii]CEG41416.1 putative polyprotein [Plasmopara halstedii]|eukprot:XP_024577785.1 putative polyprotein [Plasmopara halstedii]
MNRLVFYPGTERSRRSREPTLLLEDGLELDDERRSKESERLPSSKRPKIDEDGLLDEAMLAYAATIDGVSDIPNAYAEAVASDEAVAWRAAMKTDSYQINKTAPSLLYRTELLV